MATGSLAAQTGTVTGTVTDANTGEPIATVQVHIPELQLGMLTNADGAYALPNVPVGQYEIRAELIGRQTDAQVIDVTYRGPRGREFHAGVAGAGDGRRGRDRGCGRHPRDRAGVHRGPGAGRGRADRFGAQRSEPASGPHGGNPRDPGHGPARGRALHPVPGPDEHHAEPGPAADRRWSDLHRVPRRHRPERYREHRDRQREPPRPRSTGRARRPG